MSAPKTSRKKVVIQTPEPEDVETLVVTHVTEDLKEMTQEKSKELWAAIDQSNAQALVTMCDTADKIIKQAQDHLREGKTITDELREAQDLMYNFEIHVNQHRYTLPQGYEQYSDRNVALTILAQINDLALRGQYPKTSDGRGYSLTPMQHHILWTR